VRTAILIIGAMILAGCNQSPEQPTPQIGRFTIVQAGNRTIMLDTDAGRAWELLQDGEGATRGWVEIRGYPPPA
jgi:hypothetical protein